MSRSLEALKKSLDEEILTRNAAHEEYLFFTRMAAQKKSDALRFNGYIDDLRETIAAMEAQEKAAE